MLRVMVVSFIVIYLANSNRLVRSIAVDKMFKTSFTIVTENHFINQILEIIETYVEGDESGIYLY